MKCAEHGTNLAGESPVTSIYRQVYLQTEARMVNVNRSCKSRVCGEIWGMAAAQDESNRNETVEEAENNLQKSELLKLEEP